MILLVLAGMAYLLYRFGKSGQVDIEILDDGDPDIENNNPPPWTVIGSMGRGMLVRFHSDID